jgi:hypothetical protein
MGTALADIEAELEAAEEAAAEEEAAEEAEEEAAEEEAAEEALTPLVVGEDEAADDALSEAALDEALEEYILAASVSDAVQAFSSGFLGALTAVSGGAQWGWASGAQEVDASSGAAAGGGATVVDTSLPSGLSGGSPQWGWASDSQEVDLGAGTGDGANAKASDANIGDYTGVATGPNSTPAPPPTLNSYLSTLAPPQPLADNGNMAVDDPPSAPYFDRVENVPPPPPNAPGVEITGNPDLQDGRYLHFQITNNDGVTYDVYESDVLLHTASGDRAYLVPTSTPAPPAATPQPLDDQTPSPERQLPYTPPAFQGLGNSSIFANSPSSGIFANSPSVGIFANSAPNSTSAQTGGGSPTAVLSSLTASTGGGSPTLPPAGSFLQSNFVQGLGGFVAGIGIAGVPGGFLLAPVGQATGLLGKPTGTFAFFQGAGEIAKGIAQLAAGIGGEVGGGALDAAGAAAAPETLGASLVLTGVGASLNAASWGVIAGGVGNIGLGIVTSGHALFGDESLGPELQQSTGGGGGPGPTPLRVQDILDLLQELNEADIDVISVKGGNEWTKKELEALAAYGDVLEESGYHTKAGDAFHEALGVASGGTTGSDRVMFNFVNEIKTSYGPPDVGDFTKALKQAEGHAALGNYDGAVVTVYDVLNGVKYFVQRK